eukprot:8922274-Pyramimonas_sp.AAC.1
MPAYLSAFCFLSAFSGHRGQRAATLNRGGGRRSSSTVVTRLGRGRCPLFPSRAGAGGSQHSRARMFVAPLGNGAL